MTRACTHLVICIFEKPDNACARSERAEMFKPVFPSRIERIPIKAKLAEFFYSFGTKSVLFGALLVNP
jgi:hypothetical protein